MLGALALAAWVAATQAASEAPLELVATIAMPGVKGRIDHLAVDVKGRRLFVAALGYDTVEVLDAAGNLHVRSIPGFGEPQGVPYLPQSNRLYLANGTANRIDILDGASLTSVKRIEKVDDADNVRFDAVATRIAASRPETYHCRAIPSPSTSTQADSGHS